uniref:Transmembrane protein n=1 Tax=Cacopsylla melanoneura TaxID=428564 RepID=A0A8D9E1Q8_9HEMI
MAQQTSSSTFTTTISRLLPSRTPLSLLLLPLLVFLLHLYLTLPFPLPILRFPLHRPRSSHRPTFPDIPTTPTTTMLMGMLSTVCSLRVLQDSIWVVPMRMVHVVVVQGFPMWRRRILFRQVLLLPQPPAKSPW